MRLTRRSMAVFGACGALPKILGALLGLAVVAAVVSDERYQAAGEAASFHATSSATEVCQEGRELGVDAGTSLSAGVLDVSGDNEFCGIFAVGEAVRRVVALRNSSSVPITLSIPAKSCACVKAELTGTALAPGETAMLTIETPASIAHQGRDEVVHWVSAVAFSASSLKPIDVRRVPIRFRSARDWRAFPQSLDAIVPIGEQVEIQAIVHSASDTEIPGFRIGSCSIEGVKAHAERLGASLWRVVLTCRLDLAGKHEGVLEVEPLYRKGENIRFPILIRAEPRTRCEPAGIVFESASVQEFCVGDLPGNRSHASLCASIVPPHDAITLSRAEGKPSTFSVRSAALAVDYAGVIEVRDGAGELVALLPLAVFRCR